MTSDLPLLRAAVDQSAKGIIITDLDGIIRYVNAAFTAMSGFSAEEALGQTPRILKSGCQTTDFYADFWSTIRAGQIWRGELVNRRKEGGVYTEHMTVAPLCGSNSEPIGYIALKDDVTQQRAAEEARRFLASVVEGVNDAIVAMTPEGIIHSWNRGAQLLHGYDASEVIGHDISMLVPREEWGRLWSTIETLRRSENIPPFEGLALRKDGTQFPIDISLTPISGQDGRVTSIAAIVRDITPRKREEETRNLLASIVESSDDAIFAVSLEGNILSWNKSAERLYGYTAAEAVGQPVAILSGAEHKREPAENLERIKAGETISHFETVRTRKDGTHVDVSLTVTPILNGGGEVLGSAAVVRDMTQHKRAEEALRQSEEKYRLLVDNIPDIVWTADDQGRLTFLSDNVEAICGYSPEEVCGSALWIEKIHPQDLAAVRAAYHALLETGAKFNTEYRLRRKDGTWIWLHSRAVSHFERDGARVTVGIASDITARKHADEQLRKAKEVAEIANRAKSEFLSNMSHELRTPLNGILGFSALLLDTGVNEEQREYLGFVESSARSLLQIINDVLDFSNIEARKLAISRRPFDIETAIQSVTRSLQQRAAEKSLSLDWHIDAGVPRIVEGDPARIRQVLVNLLDNALKFTKAGSVALEVRYSAPPSGRPEVCFSVTDTGIGIPEDKLDSVFGAFVQVDMSQTRRFGGTGLGLAISSQLVELMGGTMCVTSEPGRGSTFSFTIPM